MTDTHTTCHAQPIQEITRLLRSRSDVRLAILFGSASRDALRPHSDLDLAVALTDDDPGRMSDLCAALEEVAGRTVDLLNLTGLHGFILKEVLTRGRILERRDPELHALLIRRMLFEEADWLPIKRAAMKEQLERFLS